jgi:tyrosyl-tRNA synthetase
VERFLFQLTLVPTTEVQAVAEAHAAEPRRRQGQRRLAREMTTLAHGRDEAAAAEAASAVLFGGSLDGIAEATLATLAGEVPTSTVARGRVQDGVPIVDLLVETGMASSKGDARRTLEQGGASVDGERADGESVVGEQHLLHGRYVLLRKGKRQYHLVVAEG